MRMAVLWDRCIIRIQPNLARERVSLSASAWNTSSHDLRRVPTQAVFAGRRQLRVDGRGG